MSAPELPPQPLPPMSSVAGETGRLLQLGWFRPPVCPGWLATLEHYRITGELGRGGMGLVFQAIDSRDGREVAIKLLRPELSDSPQQIHRFLKEARHMLRLQHPHILPVLQVSENLATPFFVTPLIKRGSLNRQLSEPHPLTEAEAVQIARQIGAALQHAHSRGVTHRDLKPGNILLDEKGTAFLADFGLARTLQNDSVVNPAIAVAGEGTAPYLSPQLARGEAEDTRCDIYALGALLYEMVSGRPPYEGSSVGQILEQIKHGPPVPLPTHCPSLSPDYNRIVSGAMAREHRERYANMADVVADLERYHAGQTPLGPRPSHARFPFPVTRRSLAFLGIGGALIGTLLWLNVGSRENPKLVLRQEITVPEVTNWAVSRFGDWDGDGTPDVLNLAGKDLHIVSGEGQRLKPVPVEIFSVNPPRLGMLADVNGDGLDEALVAWNDLTNAYVSAFNQRGWPVRQFRFSGALNVHPQWGTNQTFLEPLQRGDLDGDGKPELLAAVSSSWALHPRGICCFDIASGDLKWFFETATFVVQAEIRDLEGDGQSEVLVGSNSPGNGAQLADGTDDQHAYLYVLNAQGGLRWRHELAGVFATVRPLTLAITNSAVYVWVAAGHEYSVRRGEADTGKVIGFDTHGKQIATHDFQCQLTSAAAVPDGNGFRVLALDRLAQLHVLDEHLKPISQRTLFQPRFGRADLQINSIGLMGAGSPAPAIICSAEMEMRSEPAPGNSREVFETIFHHDNRVTVLNREFQPVATQLIHEKWTQRPGLAAGWLPRGTNQPPILLVLSDRIQYFGWEPQPAP